MSGSTLPDDLRGLGYCLTDEGEGQRIFLGSVVQKFALTSSGALEPITPGSARQVGEVQRHAEIARARRYETQFPLMSCSWAILECRLLTTGYIITYFSFRLVFVFAHRQPRHRRKQNCG
jgi:hypothetical protein